MTRLSWVTNWEGLEIKLRRITIGKKIKTELNLDGILLWPTSTTTDKIHDGDVQLGTCHEYDSIVAITQ